MFPFGVEMDSRFHENDNSVGRDEEGIDNCAIVCHYRAILNHFWLGKEER
jgi:hypothetical protein